MHHIAWILTKSQFGAGEPNMSCRANGELISNTFGDDRYCEETISATAATTVAARLLYT